MRIKVLASFLALAGVAALYAQAPPKFDVSTVKPNLSATGGNRIGVSGQTLTMSNVTWIRRESAFSGLKRLQPGGSGEDGFREVFCHW